MIKVLAILQIFTILTSSAGVNVFSHYCNETHTVAISLIKSDATCTDHICCSDEHTHSNDMDCCSIEETNFAVAKSSDFQIHSTDCCKDRSDYSVVANETITNKVIDEISYPNSPIIDFNIPLLVNEKMPKQIDFIDNHLYKLQLSRSLLSYIYFMSDIA